MLHQDDGSVITDVNLGAMIANADTEREPEGRRKPVDGAGEIGVGKLGDHGTAGDGTVGEHTASVCSGEN
jgi:hypothetical protein